LNNQFAMARHDSRSWEDLRLKDRIEPGVRILFVGINPGVRSAQTGHHFAGYSNRFWKLLFDGGFVPEPITFADDGRLPEFGLGITNLIPRPTPGIDTLTLAEYRAGWKVLVRKIRRFRPPTVALVGVTVWRAILPLLELDRQERTRIRTMVCPGPMPVRVEGANVFVLPNPSGRNANFSYQEMLASFRSLRADALPPHPPTRVAS
jgi:TDG/mug DNA glycosylase family protein